MKELTRLRARNLAIQFVLACLSEAEADGYQQQDGKEWMECEPVVGEATATSFIVAIGGHRIKFAAKYEVAPGGSHDHKRTGH